MAADVVCAWCGKKMGTKPGIDGVTHGLCPACEREQDRLIEEMVKEQEAEKNKGDQK